MKTKFLFFASLLIASCLFAQNPGDLDVSFGGIGYVTDGGNYDCQEPEVFLMTDGRIVVGGGCLDGTSNTFRIHRYLTDGSLDPSFGQGGVAELPNSNTSGGNGNGSINLQADNKILLLANAYMGSTYGIFLSRLNSDGTLDTGFGQGGIIYDLLSEESLHTDAVYALSSGKILVVGDYYENYTYGYFARRYHANGTLDPTYGFQGMAKAPMAGSHSIEVRRSTLDANENLLILSTASDPVNFHYSKFIRFDANGFQDLNFGQSGALNMSALTPFEETYGLTVSSTGEIFVSGTGPTFNTQRGNMALWKFRPNGTPDITFGTLGMVELNDGFADDMGMDVLVQPDGMILVAGAAEGIPINDRFFVARFHPDGTPEFGFGVGGIATPHMNQTGQFHEGWSVVLQPDGKIVVAGVSIEVIQNYYGPYDSKYTVARYMGGPVNQASGSKTDKDIAIYPNPATARTMVEVALKETEAVTLTIRDVFGREMKSKVLGSDVSAGHYRMLLDLDGLGSGQYFVTVKAGNVVHQQRLVIAK